MDLDEITYLGQGIFSEPVSLEDYLVQRIEDWGRPVSSAELTEGTGIPKGTAEGVLKRLVRDRRVRRARSSRQGPKQFRVFYVLGRGASKSKHTPETFTKRERRSGKLLEVNYTILLESVHHFRMGNNGLRCWVCKNRLSGKRREYGFLKCVCGRHYQKHSGKNQEQLYGITYQEID
jgi:hypothetical protein